MPDHAALLRVLRGETPPKRIQRSRAKGWRMPEGAIVVDRTTPWGNPFIVGTHGTAAECVQSYRLLLDGLVTVAAKGVDGPHIERQTALIRHAHHHLADLRGHDLACWCRAGQPCHASVLLELANA